MEVGFIVKLYYVIFREGTTSKYVYGELAESVSYGLSGMNVIELPLNDRSEIVISKFD